MNSFCEKNPLLLEEWDLDKNTISPQKCSFGSNIKRWWICQECRQSFQASPKNRQKTGCPFCSGKQLSDLNRFSIRCPDLLREWDFDKNDMKPDDISFSSPKKVWWVCYNGHSWQATLNSRSKKDGNGCPFCSGRRKTLDKSLKMTHPELMKEWSFEKNENDPSIVGQGSHLNVWWKCQVCCQEWQSLVFNRAIHKSGCPFCAGKQVSFLNRFDLKFPDLLKEWDYDKNIIKPEECSFGTHQKVWWKCEKDHSWETTIVNRTKPTKPTSCPYCFCGASSKGEKELFEWVKDHISTNAVNNDKKLLNGEFELDIYLPDFKLGIEFNGLYFHSELFRDEVYHSNKLERCRQKELDLFQFYEDEWRDKKDIVKSIIYSYCFPLQDEDFVLKEISKKLADEFFDKHHLLGSCEFDRCFALVQDEVIQSAVLLKMKENVLDIVRSIKISSKMIQCVESLGREKKKVKVGVYVDERFESVEFFKGQCFQVSKETPSVCFTDGIERFSIFEEGLLKIFEPKKIYLEKIIKLFVSK